IREHDGVPYQYVSNSDTWRLEVVSTLPQFPLAEVVAEYVDRPFDLSRDHMIRATLLPSSTAEEHLLVITLHHIAADGWSVPILISEVCTLYNERFFNARSSTLPTLEVQYADFACWQKRHYTNEVLDRELDYWIRNL